MAWCPFATKVPVSLRESQKRTIVPQGLVLHTAVSNSALLKPSGEVRWHFYCNKDGALYQFFDTTRPAAAQVDGNYWTVNGQGRGFISVETWDGAGTSVWSDYNSNHSGGPAWTAKQVESLAKLAKWLNDTHGVPLQKATGPRGKGIGYHRQFTNTSPYEWNSSHACPGTKRIAQVPVIIKKAVELDKPKPKPPAPKPEQPKPTPLPIPQEEFVAGIPAQLVQVEGEDAVYAVTLAGAVHVKNPTHLLFLQAQGWVTPGIRPISKTQLAELKEKE